MTTTLDTANWWLPEPEPREVRYTVISVDDHVVEPPHLFEGRMPARLQDQAPHIVETPEGQQVWEFEGQRFTQSGTNALAGRTRETINIAPVRFDQMRRGCWDIEARIQDMDINGVWASLNFPSMITGFCGRVYSQAKDQELGLAATRAWNDWLYEEWYLPHPDRIIPLGITFLSDPAVGAEEIRRNAARGFVSVTLPERPHRLGFPSIFSGYWDPIIEACVDTDTVISLHVGSSGMADYPTDSPNVQLGATLFGQMSLSACAEWVWSGYGVRYPDLKVAMSEGGIGWVAMLLDRLDNIVDRSGYGIGWDIRPADVLRRNFWFCALDDPSGFATGDVIGWENIMVESDYPHGDSTWPDTQEVIAKYWGHLPVEELRLMTHVNASRLYRHPLPEVCRP